MPRHYLALITLPHHLRFQFALSARYLHLSQNVLRVVGKSEVQDHPLFPDEALALKCEPKAGSTEMSPMIFKGFSAQRRRGCSYAEDPGDWEAKKDQIRLATLGDDEIRLKTGPEGGWWFESGALALSHVLQKLPFLGHSSAGGMGETTPSAELLDFELPSTTVALMLLLPALPSNNILEV
ncbi:hypothetical protein BJ165DRAFT_1534404 [Panaeolus papilionaceus]|nr:hypothetical protein BJ165DRAFT_1534404 [Panaeolus papilionaceus]